MKQVQTIKAAIYCKSIPGKTAKSQERDLRLLCEKYGWAVNKVYCDPAMVASLRKRMNGRARLALISDQIMQENESDVILVWRIGMLGVAIDDLLWTLDEIHVQRHIQIVAPGDEIDTTVGGGMATKVVAALAKVGQTAG